VCGFAVAEAAERVGMAPGPFTDSQSSKFRKLMALSGVCARVLFASNSGSYDNASKRQ
jgi:hypothetical protein